MQRATRVTLTADAAACVRAVIEESLLPCALADGGTTGAGSLQKRLLKVYNTVAAAGFSHDAVQAAFRAVQPRTAATVTADALFDWLCLQNTFPLPSKFTVTRAASTAGEITLLSAQRDEDVAARRVVHEDAPRFADAARGAEMEADGKDDISSWIRNYVETADSSSEASGSDGDEPPPRVCIASSDGVTRGGQCELDRFTDPLEAREPLGTALARARQGAKRSKANKDAAAQRDFGAAIKQLKEHMERLGLSEEECLNAVRPGDEDGADAAAPTSHDGGAPASTDVQPSDAEAHAADDEMGSMFDEDSFAPFTLPKTPRKQAAGAGIAVGKRSSAKSSARQPVAQPLQLPKALLQQHCQRLGWPAPRFERQPGGRGAFSYSVTLECTMPGKRKQSVLYELPDELATRATADEAQNAAACCALLGVAPEQPLFAAMPSPYSELWLTLEDLEAAREQRGDEPVEAFLAALIAECGLPKQRPAGRAAAAAASDGATRSSGRAADRGRRLQPELHRALLAREESAAYRPIAEQRESLPICAIRAELAAALGAHDALVVCGETGCGKTTQVPQYVLDDATLRGDECSVIVTQPRRVAAISIAERVAFERGEAGPGAVGAHVGYQVRNEAALTSSTRLLFCTTGILLRRLHGDALLAGTTHVILDEVHERSMDVDLLLTLLRDLPARRGAAGMPPLKLVLMSATINAAMFSAYLGGCPVLSAEGRTFPVTPHYLEDVYELTGYLLPPDSPAAFRATQRRGRQPAAARSDTKEGRLLREGWGDEDADAAALNPGYEASAYAQFSERTRISLSRVNEEVLDFELLEELLAVIHESRGPGAVLVFMPGIREVEALHARLTATRRFSGDGVCILPLHSALSSAEQRRVFQPTRRGARKVVIATNIAETSLTLEDVVFVIDTGRQKCRQYNPKRGITSLEARGAHANITARIAEATTLHRKNGCPKRTQSSARGVPAA